MKYVLILMALFTISGCAAVQPVADTKITPEVLVDAMFNAGCDPVSLKYDGRRDQTTIHCEDE